MEKSDQWVFLSDDGHRLPFSKRGRVCSPKVLRGRAHVEHCQHYLDTFPSCRNPVRPDTRHGRHPSLVATWALGGEERRNTQQNLKKARCSHGTESHPLQGSTLVLDLKHQTSAPVSEGGFCTALVVRVAGEVHWLGVSRGLRYH